MTDRAPGRITGIGLIDDAIVSAISIGGQFAIVAIMLPVLVVVMIGSVTLAVLTWFALVLVLDAVGVRPEVVGALAFVPLLAALGLTMVVAVKVYRRLPRRLRAAAFPEELVDREPAVAVGGALTGSPADTAPRPTLQELDARLGSDAGPNRD